MNGQYFPSHWLSSRTCSPAVAAALPAGSPLNPSDTSAVLEVNFCLWLSTYYDCIREYGLFFQSSQLEMNLNYFIYTTMAWPSAPLEYSYAYSKWWQISLNLSQIRFYHLECKTVFPRKIHLHSKAVTNTSCSYSSISLIICKPLV